jgi:hypothetical protein
MSFQAICILSLSIWFEKRYLQFTQWYPWVSDFWWPMQSSGPDHLNIFAGFSNFFLYFRMKIEILKEFNFFSDVSKWSLIMKAANLHVIFGIEFWLMGLNCNCPHLAFDAIRFLNIFQAQIKLFLCQMSDIGPPPSVGLWQSFDRFRSGLRMVNKWSGNVLKNFGPEIYLR